MQTFPGNFDFPFRKIENSHLICFCRDKLRHACQHFSRKSVVHFSPNLDKSLLGNFQSEKLQNAMIIKFFFIF